MADVQATTVATLLKGDTSPDHARLLAWTMDRSVAEIRSRPDLLVEPEVLTLYLELSQRLTAGEPLAYVMGTWEFWSLELEVTPAVLIPRPDTETLVEVALATIKSVKAPRIADLGTGSGAIAVALGVERSDASIVATDTSEAALEVAKRNAARHSLAIEFRTGSWSEPLEPDTYDLIVSNPPYVRADDPHLTQGDLPHEPREALVSGPTGLEAYELIVAGSIQCLRDDGTLAVEHGYDQRSDVVALMKSHGYRHVRGDEDLTSTPRIVSGQHPG